MAHPYFHYRSCLTFALALALASPISARMYHTHFPYVNEDVSSSMPTFEKDSTTLASTMAEGGGGSGGQKVWCVAKPAANDEYLRRNLDFACAAAGGNVDCRAVLPGGACFLPNTPIAHASYAMNLYYQKNGRNWWTCVFNNTALLVSTDPSFGNCNYPAQWI